MKFKLKKKNKDDYGLKYVDNNCNALKCNEYKIQFPPQSQDDQPGLEYLMNPRPIFDNPKYKASGKLKGKVAIVTGGDSGLGRAISVAYAKEGATVVISYLNEDKDANETKKYIDNLGGKCILIRGDLTNSAFCKDLINRVIEKYKCIDILVNNAGVQYQQKDLTDISNEQFDFTMKSNVYSMFYLTKYALPYMKQNSSIINLSSITTFKGEPELIDYVASKGAIVGFTRSLATNLALKTIRVNAVAPGFFWTPLQPACWEESKIPTLGADSDMRRGAQPFEIAPLFVYLASDDSSYVTGQTFHINGGEYKG